MAKQIKRLSLYISTLIMSLILSIFATGCSANYHIRKAISKGYRCEEGFADTIRISSIDSIPYVLRDSIAWERVIVQKDTIVHYRASKVPKTRFEIRFDNRRFADSLKNVRKMYSDNLKAYKKINFDRVKAYKKIVQIQTKPQYKFKIDWRYVIVAYILGFFTRLSISETFRSRISLLTKFLK